MIQNLSAIDFMRVIIDARRSFRQMHVDIERAAISNNVSTNVTPFKNEVSDFSDEIIAVSIDLAAELVDYSDPEKSVIGVSLSYSFCGNGCEIEASFGWIGDISGWAPTSTWEHRCAVPEDLAPITNEMLKNLRGCVDEFLWNP
jgi:hypothetical protein